MDFDRSIEKNVKAGDLLEQLLITDLTVEGQGVARYGKQVVFLDQGLPGALVCALATRIAKGVIHARVERQVAPSPHEISPWCPHFGECGACMWQHLSADAALEWKHGHVRQTLARIGRLPDVPVEAVLASPMQKGFRNKMSYVFAEDPAGKTLLGLRHPKGHTVVEVERCALQDPVAMQILSFVRKEVEGLGLRALRPEVSAAGKKQPRGYLRFLVIRTPLMRDSDGSRQIVVECISGAAHDSPAANGKSNIEALHTLGRSLNTHFSCSFVHSERRDKADVAQGEKNIFVSGRDSFRESFGNVILSVPYNAFLQTNTRSAEMLYQLVEREANLRGGDVLWDIYCGIGSAGFCAIRDGVGLHGFELQAASVKAARQNASALGLANCFFHAGDVYGTLAARDIPRPDVIIVDPPRAGLSHGVREHLLNSRARRLLYISCNPATQARDAAALSTKWNAVKSLPVDMFPYTPHVENLLVFDHA